MIKILFYILFAAMAQTAGAQVPATDFTAEDCMGNTHNLYSYLDSGNAVVICWVMPCSMCEGPAISANRVTAGFGQSLPGKVVYFVVDDYGNTPCNQMSTWLNTHDLTYAIALSDTSVSMLDYGPYGMPKTVVIGPDREVYFQANGAAADDSVAIRNAINQALGSSLSVITTGGPADLSLYPNPSSGESMLMFTLPDASYILAELYDQGGRKLQTIFSGNRPAGKQILAVHTSGLKTGSYLVRIKAGDSVWTARLLKD